MYCSERIRENIKANKLKVGLTFEENIKGNLTVADIISDSRELPKEGFEKIELLKDEIINFLMGNVL